MSRRIAEHLLGREGAAITVLSMAAQKRLDQAVSSTLVAKFANAHTCPGTRSWGQVAYQAPCRPVPIRDLLRDYRRVSSLPRRVSLHHARHQVSTESVDISAARPAVLKPEIRTPGTAEGEE
jgi:hypothetical protein